MSFRGDRAIKNWLKTSLAFPTVWIWIYFLGSIAGSKMVATIPNGTFRWPHWAQNCFFLFVSGCVGGVVKVEADLTINDLHFSAGVPMWFFIHLPISTPFWGYTSLCSLCRFFLEHGVPLQVFFLFVFCALGIRIMLDICFHIIIFISFFISLSFCLCFFSPFLIFSGPQTMCLSECVFSYV